MTNNILWSANHIIHERQQLLVTKKSYNLDWNLTLFNGDLIHGSLCQNLYIGIVGYIVILFAIFNIFVIKLQDVIQFAIS